MNASLDTRHLLDAPLASARALPFGTHIEHLDIVRDIAETDVGIEYLAIDRASRAEVVVKEYLPARLARREGTVMRPHTLSEAAKLALGLQAFIAEPRLMAHTEHRALACVIGVIEANDTAYHVMSHGGGTPLRQLRKEMNGAPDEPRLRALLDDLLGALEALHHDGAVHGAVAPDHVLMLADDRPLLLQPAPARATAASGLIESLMASVEPSFTAPEQRASSPVQMLSAATDLYSLAETMRYCISGELPPRVSDPAASGPREPMAQMVRRLFGNTLAPRYSASLLGTLDAALDTNPLMRPQSAAEFRDALIAAPACVAAPVAPRAAAVPATPRAPGAAHTTFRPPRQQHRSAWVGAVLALLLVAGTLGWWHFDQTARTGIATAVVPPRAEVAAIATPPAPETIVESMPPAAPAAPPAPPEPVARAKTLPASPPSAAIPASPRESCGDRTQFALYRCLQALCEQRGWSKHPQCERLRETDSVE